MEFDPELDRVKILFLVAGVILGSVATLGYQNFNSNAGKASQNLVDFLENQSGQELEVMQSEEIGDFYRVEVRTQQDRLVTYYTSSNGLFTQNMQDIGEFRERTQALVDFKQCLSDSGTVMYGNSSQQATQRQIQNLGGASVVAPIYRDISNRTNLRQAVQLGVQRIPALYRDQNVAQGVQSLQQVEQFTGCDYTAN